MPGHVMQLFLFIYYTDENILRNPESEDPDPWRKEAVKL